MMDLISIGFLGVHFLQEVIQLIFKRVDRGRLHARRRIDRSPLYTYRLSFATKRLCGHSDNMGVYIVWTNDLSIYDHLELSWRIWLDRYGIFFTIRSALYNARVPELRVFVWRCLRYRDLTFSRIIIAPTCDRQTDRQTQHYGIYRANMASRGKTGETKLCETRIVILHLTVAGGVYHWCLHRAAHAQCRYHSACSHAHNKMADVCWRCSVRRTLV